MPNVDHRVPRTQRLVTGRITPRLGLERARELLDVAQADAPRWSPRAVQVEDVAVPDGGREPVLVRIFRPAGREGPLPIVLYAHGPGWVLGSALTHDRLLRELAASALAAVVLVQYTRAPEARYPTQITQCRAVLEWAARDSERRGLDHTRIALAGDSAGANLALAAGLLARTGDGPDVCAQLLFCPVCDAACDTPSYRRYARGPGFGRQTMRWFWAQYAPDVAARAQVTCSPLRASPLQLTGTPPTLLLTAEQDVLRDEGEAYAAKLAAAGVPVTAIRYQGVPGDFVVLEALRDRPPAREALRQAGAFLSAALRSAS